MLLPMDEWFASGIMIDIILAAVLLECLFLVWLSRRRMKDVTVWLPGLLAGAALLIALRLVIAGTAWSWVAGLLAVALLAHVVDMVFRFGVPR